MSDPVISYTPFYKLAKLRFDVARWGSVFNKNLDLLDALLRQLGVSAIKGNWLNATSYLIGDRTFDDVTGELFQCLVANTSPVSGTFAAYRAANPTHWLQATNLPSSRGLWTSGVNYNVNDIAYAGDVWRMCVAQHVSDNTVANNFSSTRWTTIVDLTGSVNAAAASAANAATAVNEAVRYNTAQTKTITERAQARSNIRLNRSLARTITSASSVADRTLTEADGGRLIIISGTTDFTITVDPVSGLGAGWSVYLKNIGRCVATVDPNGSEAIDGVASATLPIAFKQEIELVSTGTEFYSIGSNTQTLLERFNSSSIANVDLLLPRGYRTFEGNISFTGVGANREVAIRLSTNGGSTFLAGASDYIYGAILINTGNVIQLVSGDFSDRIPLLALIDASASGPWNSLTFTLNNALDAATISSMNASGSGIRPGIVTLSPQLFSGYRGALEAHNAMRIFGVGGNISIRGELYGIP
jgi:hypothetical protein